MNIKPIAGIIAVSLALACATAQAQDACAGAVNCASSGAVRANIASATPSQDAKGGHQYLTVRVSFSNLGKTPLILNYKQDSGKMSDEYGQQYSVDWRRADAVSGIPVATRNKASSQFTLAPGESRTATFRYERYVGKTALGTVFEPSLVVEQYALLPSNQLRLEREHPLWFGQVQVAGAANFGKAVDGLRDLFNKK